ncbi:unnamed protein product [Leptosia nina]|uniref:G-protein coupled receptors family 2 profile 2 domain-containing protein n=1 Tax=Leptosia nina TaxID=320188 RepID=A0AAV1JQZ2_9NEOP
MYSYLFCLVILISQISCYDLILEEEDFDIFCSFKKCLNKCCDRNEYMNGTEPGSSVCVEYDGDGTLDYSKIQLYDEEDHDRPVNENFGDLFRLKPGLMREEIFAMESYVPQYIQLRTFLNKRGIVFMEMPNAYQRWTPIEPDKFCADFAPDDYGNLTVFFWVYTETVVENNDYYYIALLVSSFFLALLLIVYAILPELRNMQGKVLMSYVASLLGAFLSLVAMQIGSYPKETCVALSTIIYFFFLAAFSWMNVMSYDIWWTFRGYAKARPIHRRGKKFKFIMYCLYAWGVPIIMAIAFVCMNEADLSDQPWIIKPMIPNHGCFLAGGQKYVYLYLPMLILIVCNWIFYLMTAFNVWRLRRGTAVLNSPAAGNPASHRSQKQRFTLYLKLSVIMGINWILEVVSSFYPDWEIWYITDAYNLLIGVTMFVIFIYKESIYNKLMIKYKTIRRHSFPKRSTTTSITQESNLSQDLPNICPHPNFQRKLSNVQRPDVLV